MTVVQVAGVVVIETQVIMIEFMIMTEQYPNNSCTQSNGIQTYLATFIKLYHDDIVADPDASKTTKY